MLENCKIKVFGLLKFLCAYGIIISFSFQNTNDMKKSAFICPLIETQFGLRDCF